jgi:hypothetical protein
MARSKPHKPAAGRKKPPLITGPIQVTDERVTVAGPTDERIMLPRIPPTWPYFRRALRGEPIPWDVSDAEDRHWTEWHPLHAAPRPARRAKTDSSKGGRPPHPLAVQVRALLVANKALSDRAIAKTVNARAKGTESISAKTVGRIRRSAL